MNFQTRSKLHDKIAIPYTIGLLKKYGYDDIVTQGHEYDKKELRQLLAQRRDRISLMKRYKPDIIAAKNDELVFCEVKSDQNRHKNYAIEFDSYIASKEHRKSGSVIYSFIDILTPSFDGIIAPKICDCNDIILPYQINVPDRFDYQITLQYINDHYPSNHANISQHRNGSGTAFFLIPKSSRYLIEWKDFFSLKITQLSFEEFTKE